MRLYLLVSCHQAYLTLCLLLFQYGIQPCQEADGPFNPRCLEVLKFLSTVVICFEYFTRDSYYPFIEKKLIFLYRLKIIFIMPYGCCL